MNETTPIPQPCMEEEVCPAEVGFESLALADRLNLDLRMLYNAVQHSDSAFGGRKNVLTILARRGAMSQRALAEAAGVRPGSLSELLGKLEADGLVLRRPDPDDRRAQDVYLTDLGIEEELRFRERSRESIERNYASLTEAEQTTLCELIEKLVGGWQV